MFDFSKREQILIGLIVLLMVIYGVTLYYFLSANDEDVAFQLVEGSDTAVYSSSIADEPEIIVIYVTGAVKYPGVYELNKGDRVKDAIDVAGGTLPDADLLRINLAQKLLDEDKVYIPKIGEESGNRGGVDYLIPGVNSSESGKININNAGLAELEQLPGIGPATAQKIIDYRTKNGRFNSIEELKNVSGIGDKKYEDLKDKITVR